MTKPVLFVTNHAPPFRIGAFTRAAASARTSSFALIGGDVRHGGGGTTADELPFRAIVTAAARGRAARRSGATERRRSPACRGRVALPAAYAGARARIPFVLWATIWAPPAHAGPRALLSRRCATSTATPTRSPPTARTSAPTFAPKGARGPVIEAPQAVDARVLGRSRPIPDRRGGLPGPVRGPARAREGPRRARSAARDGTLVVARAPVSRPNCATPTRAATLWSYRRSPRATSSSRGASSSTKPSTRESP